MKIENSIAVEQTVKEALSQNKNVKNIYLIGSNNKSAGDIKNLSKIYIKKYSSIIPKSLDNLSFEEMEEVLKKIPKDSIIFYSLFFKDKNGVKLTPKKYLNKFLKISNAPTYVYFSTLLDSNVVGGYVIDSELLVQNMFKTLISNKKIEENKYDNIRAKFNYNILQKYNIDINKIPKDSVLLNRPDNYLKINKQNILILTTLIILLIFIVILFVLTKRKKKVIEELNIKNKLLSVKREFDNFFELSINLQIITNIENGNLIQINSGAKNILGYEIDELINTSFLDLIHPDDIQNTIDEMSKLANGEIVYYFENRYRHKNGTYVNLAWSATTDTKKKLVYASAQDITKVKLIESQKKEKEKLLNQQSKLAAMGEMLNNIAHQWRQPLSTISTSATGTKIQKELDCLSDTQLHNALDTINNSAQYLSQTIDDFRNFFNPANDKISKFLIDKTIDKTLNIISSELNNKNIKVIKNSSNIEVLLIENELIQVLVNIINNAKDALVKIENKKRLIFIDIYEDENTLIIEIKDNAKGIPLNIIDRIFEPYFTTKHKSQGTGIGLYMSREIIVNHLKGSINVENETYIYEDIEYIGSKFTIKLSQ